MVNAEKHKEEFVKPEDLQELEMAVLNTVINYTDKLLKDLNTAKKQYNRIIKRLIADKGAFISADTCSAIMEERLRLDFILETVKLYYNAITLPSGKLEEVKDSLEEALNLIMKIEKLQNRNLDNKNYGGYGTAILTESFKKADELSNYTTKEHEEILRLKQ